MHSDTVVGFLKVMSSLQGLHILINMLTTFRLCVLWIISCIVLHSFAWTMKLVGTPLLMSSSGRNELMEDEHIQ